MTSDYNSQSYKNHIAICKARLYNMGFVAVSDNLVASVTTTMGTVYMIDFSAINPEHYLSYALSTVFAQGVDAGQKDVKMNLKKILEC